MGLLDLLPGFGSPDPVLPDPGEESVPVHQMFLVDEAPWEREFTNYRLMLGSAEGVPEDSQDELGDIEGNWFLYRCTEPTTIPEGTKLYVFQNGSIVSITGNPYRLHLAQLVQPEDVDRDNYDGTYVDFPDELTGKTFPERRDLSDEELKQALISVSVQEQVAP